MENAIVISLLVVILVLALLGVANRLRGSGCCGGKRYKPKKKRLSAVRDTCVFTVSDMHCENCKRRVDLKKGRVTVYVESEIDRDAIKRRIEQAGYSVCDSL